MAMKSCIAHSFFRVPQETKVPGDLTHLPLVPHICQWTGSSLVQVMACCLFGTKPLPETMLPVCQLNPWEQISMKFLSEFYHFHSRKCIWKCCLPQWRPLCSGGDELSSKYRKTSSKSRTKSRNLNVSCIPLQLSSLNPLKSGVKLTMKM